MGIHYDNFVLDVTLKARIRNVFEPSDLCVWRWNVQTCVCVCACIFSSTPVAHAEHEMAYLLAQTQFQCLLCALHVLGEASLSFSKQPAQKCMQDSSVLIRLVVIYPWCILLCWHLFVLTLSADPHTKQGGNQNGEIMREMSVLRKADKMSDAQKLYLMWHVCIVLVRADVVSETWKGRGFSGDETERDIFSHKQILSLPLLPPFSLGKSPTGGERRDVVVFSLKCCATLAFSPSCVHLSPPQLFLQHNNNLLESNFPPSSACFRLTLQHPLLPQSHSHHPFIPPPPTLLSCIPSSPPLSSPAAELQQAIIDQLNWRR